MRPLNDLEKSCASYVLGMALVVSIVAWRTKGDTTALTLTVGIPSFLFLLWSFHERKLQRIRRVNEGLGRHLKFVQRQKEARSAREKIDRILNPSFSQKYPSYAPTPHRGERRVLLPRNHEITKTRLLLGRDVMALEDADLDQRDQWHS